MHVTQINSNQQVQNIGEQQTSYSASAPFKVRRPHNHNNTVQQYHNGTFKNLFQC